MTFNYERKDEYTDAELKEILASLSGHDEEACILYDAPDHEPFLSSLLRRQFIIAAIIPAPAPEAFQHAVNALSYDPYKEREKIGEKFNLESDLICEDEPEVFKERRNAMCRIVSSSFNSSNSSLNFTNSFITPQGYKSKKGKEDFMSMHSHVGFTVHLTIRGGLEYFSGGKNAEADASEEILKRIRNTTPGDIAIFYDDLLHRTSHRGMEERWTYNIASFGWN